MDTDVQAQLDALNRDITVLHVPDKITVVSPYKLSKSELDAVKKLLPASGAMSIVNVVDENIFSGLVIKVGSKMIDLTLNGVLQNLRKQFYESN